MNVLHFSKEMETKMPNLTEPQTLCLSIIDRINRDEHDGWFLRSTVMSVIQIESAFRQFARRFEPRINDASYGYMQLLSGTAASIGYTGPVFPHMPDSTMDPTAFAAAIPGTLYDPAVNIPLGMRYLHDGWRHLARAFGRKPTLSEFFAGYNEGYGAAARGRPDPSYIAVALPAFRHWLAVLDEHDRYNAADLTE